MTIAERWTDVSDRLLANKGERPAPTMPTMTEWALMLLITALYWWLYHEFGPEACGDEGTEPRTTWEQGGSFSDGRRAIFGV